MSDLGLQALVLLAFEWLEHLESELSTRIDPLDAVVDAMVLHHQFSPGSTGRVPARHEVLIAWLFLERIREVSRLSAEESPVPSFSELARSSDHRGVRMLLNALSTDDLEDLLEAFVHGHVTSAALEIRDPAVRWLESRLDRMISTFPEHGQP